MTATSRGWVRRRLLLGAGQIAAVPVLVFVLTEALPGDAAVVAAGDDPDPARIAALRASLRLDRPAVERFADWAGELAHGDLGRSLVGGRPVADHLAEALGPTLLLAALTLTLLVPAAVGLGLLAARREGGPLDRAVSTVTLAVYAVPEFALGVLLTGVFALWLGWLPPTAVGGIGRQPAVLVLPVVVLLARPVCSTARLVRAGLLDAMAAPYAVHALRCGVPPHRVRLGHALPNALAPVVQHLARTTEWLLCGVIVAEALFVVPGLGTVLLDAVAARDVPVVQGLAVLFGTVTVLLNLAADLAARRLAPRTEVAV
ncbi:ABC transporter permease [Kitasatospora purpeofusca]|uniref:ABC transporter permease n=1 Tax=Kitasatospora purpeofusca TaxID=67352 RepID=UPI000A94675F|nr:ABC transporter permease [Kitasatospora purpeofusca]